MKSKSWPVRATSMAAIVFGCAMPAVAKNTAMVFNGIVRHVSATNIKVYDPKTRQTVGFGLAPKFKNVFRANDQTTQLAAIKPGQYVKVYYDRKLLGVAHADRIYLLSQDNARIGKQ